uniref:interleukin-17 receptor A-like isoform X2 n=1 Tax=Myxine glutinosa TaxID=7769 RepID=UPI00358F29C5
MAIKSTLRSPLRVLLFLITVRHGGNLVQALNCSLVEGHLPFPSKQKFTPSEPLRVSVSVLIQKDQFGKVHSMLNVSWHVSPDGSVKYLKGAKLIALTIQGNHEQRALCQYDPDVQASNPMELPTFHFLQFKGKPGESYFVYLYHLPHSWWDDFYAGSAFTMPGCEDPQMKDVDMCVNMMPEIDANLSCSSGILTASFYMDPRCTAYRLVLEGQLKGDEKQSIVTSEIKNEDSGSRRLHNFSVKLDQETFVKYFVEIIPYCEGCSNDCWRKTLSANGCKKEYPLNLAYLSLIPVGLLFISFVVLLIHVFWSKPFFHKVCASTHLPADIDKFPLTNLHKVPEVSCRKQVLLLYSHDHKEYSHLVLSLAAFLQEHCGLLVAMDLLEQQQIGKIGYLPWLIRKKQLVEATDGKIIVLCSRGMYAKWQRACQDCEPPLKLKEDASSLLGDTFTPSIGLICSDLRHSGAFAKYIVAFFEGVSGERDIPGIFKPTVTYRLMEHLEDLVLRLHGVERYSHGAESRAAGLAPDDYGKTGSGQKLHAAFVKCKTWQDNNPDWLEKPHYPIEENTNFCSIMDDTRAADGEEKDNGQKHVHQVHQDEQQSYIEESPDRSKRCILSSLRSTGMMSKQGVRSEVARNMVCIDGYPFASDLGASSLDDRQMYRAQFGPGLTLVDHLCTSDHNLLPPASQPFMISELLPNSCEHSCQCELLGEDTMVSANLGQAQCGESSIEYDSGMGMSIEQEMMSANAPLLNRSLLMKYEEQMKDPAFNSVSSTQIHRLF